MFGQILFFRRSALFFSSQKGSEQFLAILHHPTIAATALQHGLVRHLALYPITLTVTASVLTTAFVSYCLHKITLTHHASQWEQKRAAERTGRIRTEIKLRTALKQQPQPNKSNTFTLKQIGTVISPYTKRMGTPRQGALCPSSRAYVEFSHDIQPAALEGLEQYSHVWIIFEFHANTDLAGESRKSKAR